jgi:DinB family protein
MSVLSASGASAATQAGAYTAALLELLGDRDPLDVLRTTPAAISVVVSGLVPSQIETPERPGKWSIRDVVQHLGDAEMVVGVRLRMVLAQDRPPLIGYDQDAWVDRLRYREVPLADALEQFTLIRRVNLRLWAGLTHADLGRAGVHNERGEETLGFMRNIHAGHDLAHLRQLSRISSTVSGTAH